MTTAGGAGPRSPVQRLDVLLVIDVLGSGGAQRQLCELAALLHERGVSVHILTYHPADFYLDFLRERGIRHTTAPRRLGRLGRMRMVWRAIRSMRPRVVCSFLTGSGLMAELARLCRIGDFRLVVSERHADSRMTASVRFRHLMHSCADRVVVNSEVQRRFIAANAGWLADRTTCIRNCVDLERFAPSGRQAVNERLRFAVVASYTPLKNPFGLLRGFAAYRAAAGPDAGRLDWYGNVNNSAEIYRASLALRDDLGLELDVALHDQVERIETVYRSADALCLASLSEATPNVICEAMASGLPVVASRVGDIPELIREGEHGFLFDPQRPESIAAALGQMMRLGPGGRVAMGVRNRQRAIELFGRERFGDAWQAVLHPGHGGAHSERA
jgi:glycosyltransferase involved in cell wall biosynthesis